MSQDHQTIEAALRVRMRSIDSGRDAGNGTLLADAAATLIAADAVAARATAAMIADLTDDELNRWMTTVQLLVAAGARTEAALPFGTQAISHEVGSVTLASQEYVLVAQHAGMVREELAPRHADGINLEHLLRLIDPRSKRLACRPLGRPEPITHEGLIEEFALRFAPCDEAGDVRLEVPLGVRPIAWTTHADLIRIAMVVVRAMRKFWRSRQEIAARAFDRSTAFADLVRAAGRDADGLTLIGMVAQPFQTLPDVQVPLLLLVTTFDGALRPTVARWETHSGEDTLHTMRNLVRQHAWALNRIAKREPVEIDELAAAIAEAAPEGADAVLKRLASDLATDVVLPLPDQRSLVTRLHWACGMISAHIFPTQTVTHSSNSFMVLDGDWPETILDSLVGRGIGEIIDLPMHCPFPIRRAERSGARRLRLSYHTETRLVDFATRTIGPAQNRDQRALAA